ncbi:MAG: hypothetical protein ABGX16_16155 [Pirellulales bacterium]
MRKISLLPLSALASSPTHAGWSTRFTEHFGWTRWWSMQSMHRSYLAPLCGIVWLIMTPANLEGTVQVVPGTASVVDLNTSVEVIVNGITAQGSENVSKTRLVGMQWPEPSFPPFADPNDWTLNVSRDVVDLEDRSFAAAWAQYEANYNGLQTDLLLGASAEGFSTSVISPGDDSFIANGNINGNLNMFLTSNNTADPPGPYDVNLGVTITGDKLSATLLAAAASMSYFVRITPDGGMPVVFNNAFTDLAPPLGGPPFVIQHNIDFLGVLLVPNSHTFFAEVEFGVGIDDALETFVDGRTLAQPQISFAEANSMFNSTLALHFTAQPTVPEPATLLLALVGLTLLPRRRRRYLINSPKHGACAAKQEF